MASWSLVNFAILHYTGALRADFISDLVSKHRNIFPVSSRTTFPDRWFELSRVLLHSRKVAP